MKWSKRTIAVTTALPTVLFVSFIIAEILISTFRSHSFDLQSIAVPNSLVENGLSAEVITRQLRDAIQEIHDSANTSSTKSTIDLAGEEINITIPKAGISIDSVATAVRRMLPGTLQHEVSGEITQTGTAEFSIHLRINAKLVFVESYGGPNPSSVLIRHGALRLIEEIEPNIAASWLYENNFNGDLQEADAAADRAMASFPDDKEARARAFNLKGLIQKKQGRLDMAEMYYRKAAPDLPLAWSNIGDIYYEQGRLDEAISAYRKNMRLQPTDSYPYRRLGDLMAGQRKFEEALTAYKNESILDPSSPIPHRGRGDVFAAEGKIEAAISEYRLALWIRPNSSAAHNGMANILQALGKLDQAASEYNLAIQLDPTSAKPHVGLGNVLCDQGNTDEAISEYRQAIQLNARYAPAHDELAMALRSQGKKEEAISEYITAVKLDPRLGSP